METEKRPSKEDLIEALRRSSNEFNELRKKWDIFPFVDLGRARLSGVNLSGVNFHMAILAETDFSGANLSGTHFYEANLRGANLSGADLSGANLSGADLTEANVAGANFSGVNLSGANLWKTQGLPKSVFEDWLKKLQDSIVFSEQVPLACETQ